MTKRKRLELPPEIMDEIKKHDRYPAHKNELIKERLEQYYQERLVEVQREAHKPAMGSFVTILGVPVIVTGYNFNSMPRVDRQGVILEPVCELSSVVVSYFSPHGLIENKISIELFRAIEYPPVETKALTLKEYQEDLAKQYGWKTD